MKHIIYSLIVCLALLAVGTSCSSVRGFPPAYSINNFDTVNETLCRGAQPNERGLQALKRVFHVDIVVNFQEKDDAWPAESANCAALGMEYIHIPLEGVTAPKRANIERVLTIYRDAKAAGKRVFWHCKYGCDRTGTLVACERIRFEGWSNQDALQEAKTYGMASFFMKHLIKNFK